MKTKSTGTCPNCSGSGKYHGRGETVNGIFRGFVGDCFNCKGKGWTTAEDDRRNNYYWTKGAGSKLHLV